MDKPLSKKEYQQLTRRLAEIQANQRELQEIDELTDWLQANMGNEDVPVRLIVASLSKLTRLVTKNEMHLDPWFIKQMRMLDKAARIPERWTRELDRQFKIAERKVQELQQVEPAPKICTNCNKREAHFGDYCKRCADELGVRPHGKVGQE